MAKEYINPKSLFPSLPVGFSQIVTATGGKTVYLSGQTAWDPNRQVVGGKDLGLQTKHTLLNIQTAMKEAGGSLADVVSLRIYIVDYQPQQAAAVSAMLREFFPEDRRPASTWIGVATLAVPDFLIEIEAIAVIEPL